MIIKIPQAVLFIIERLTEKGFSAYIAGGCVRDSLLGKVPNDWDVATSARPEQVMDVFSDLRCIETGLRHGTVTVISQGLPIEITTFRIEGDYSDNRHPDSVSFTTELEHDLGRRDFTINSMAYSPSRGLVDLYKGTEDLRNRLIRCVGSPEKRFNEDGLRIIRALRFASVLGFGIEKNTERAIVQNKGLLNSIAKERISEELVKLICGEGAGRILLGFPQIISLIIPELEQTIGFAQNNPHHIFTVYEHMVRSVDAILPRPDLRLTMLLHDIAKPKYYFTDEKGIGHFYGHPLAGEQMARTILRRLKLDNKTVNTVCTLIKYHDTKIEPTSASVKRWLGKLGEQNLRKLFLVKIADCKAQHPSRKTRLEEIKKLNGLLDNIIAERQCFSLRDLDISGRDILKLGCPQGKKIGLILQVLLDEVISEKLINNKKILLKRAKVLIRGLE